MDLLVIDSHDGEKAFPLFKKGTPVSDLIVGTDTEYPHWFPCMIDGNKTFIPDIYVTDGILVQDFNPTELAIEKGEVVTVLNLVYGWIYVRTEDGCKGWLPASKVISIQFEA